MEKKYIEEMRIGERERKKDKLQWRENIFKELDREDKRKRKKENYLNHLERIRVCKKDNFQTQYQNEM